MTVKLTEKPEKTKRSPIKDLAQLQYEFREAAEPLTYLLEERTARLEGASEKAIPYILNDIQNLSEGITNLEALVNKLIGYYVELSDGYLYTEKMWKENSDAVKVLKEGILTAEIDRHAVGEIILNVQKIALHDTH